jgi:uncharacterized membrane protein
MIHLSISNNNTVERHLRLILLLALILRLFGLTAFSLSNDELSALSRLQFDSLSEVIQNGVYPDFHPAGVQVFLYVWTSVFGFSDWMVRLPFALMGVLSVYLLYRIGRAWFGVSTGLLAAGVLSVLMFPLLYSQIARPYSPGLLASLGSVFFLTSFAGVDKDKFGNPYPMGRFRDGLLFVLCVSCCMYIHYFSFIFAGLVCFSGLFLIRRALFTKYFLCGLAIVILYLPGYDVFIHQLEKGGLGGPDGWLSAPSSDAFSLYLDYVFNDSRYLKLICFISFTGIVLIYRGKVLLGKWHLLSLLFFLVPFGIAYFYSVLVNPVFQYSILLFSMPFLLLFIFSFLPSNRYGITAKVILFMVVFAGFYSTIYEKGYYRKQHFTEFRSIADSINKAISNYGKDAVTVITNIHSPYYLNHYLSTDFQLDSNMVTRITNEQERFAFNTNVLSSEKPFLIYAYSNIYTPPERDVFIRYYFPNLIAIDTFLNSGFRLYAKEDKIQSLQSIPDLTFMLNKSDSAYKSRYDSNSNSISFNSSDEFGPALSLSSSNVGLRPGNFLYGQAIINGYDKLEGVAIVIAIEKNGQKSLYKSIDASLFDGGTNQTICIPIVAEVKETIPLDSELTIYLWNRGKRSFKVQLLKLDVFHSKPNTFFPPM